MPYPSKAAALLKLGMNKDGRVSGKGHAETATLHSPLWPMSNREARPDVWSPQKQANVVVVNGGGTPDAMNNPTKLDHLQCRRRFDSST
ncbi:unnamed protein product [Caenorhabditis auriculariae]|uniref:Uncharacterized protein n=1 Tax=Caenorhabditis auriculariae TaxID=2777116 RepID=A0A8S1HEV4_9PELO|nr:unnamed protein product [Caenorhabditis auriculariae]